MKYNQVYEQIINKRKLHIPDGYVEVHHILPRCLGGTDDKENLIKLTAREHFICHQLLTKIYAKYSLEWYKMNHAFMHMFVYSKNNSKRYINSKTYERYRKVFSDVMSIAQSGKRNSQYKKIWIKNIDLCECKKHLENEDIPSGWSKGRVSNWEKFFEKNKKIEQKKETKQQMKERIRLLYEEFINGDIDSLNKFSSVVGINRQILVKEWKKMFPEFKTYKRQAAKITLIRGEPVYEYADISKDEIEKNRREKLSRAFTGRKLSNETKKKISESLRHRHRNN